MSWLRDHFYQFVFPAMMAAEQPVDHMGDPLDVMVSPSAPANYPTELRKLWTLCKALGVPWSTDVREDGTGSSLYRTTAQIHHRILRNTMDSLVSTMKSEGCPRLLLPGRDVWTLAVLAERRGIPYVFLPEVSRRVAESKGIKDFLHSHGVTGNELVVDTGYAGSVPKAFSRAFGHPVKFRLMSQNDDTAHLGFAPEWWLFPWKKPGRSLQPRSGIESRPNQVFPNRKRARAEVLETEYLAKYWKTGTTTTIQFPKIGSVSPGAQFMVTHDQNGEEVGLWLDLNGNQVGAPVRGNPHTTKIIQFLSSRENIMRAAIITSMLYRGIERLPPG